MLVLNVENSAALFDTIVERLEDVIPTLEEADMRMVCAAFDAALVRVTAAEEDIAIVVYPSNVEVRVSFTIPPPLTEDVRFN